MCSEVMYFTILARARPNFKAIHGLASFCLKKMRPSLSPGQSTMIPSSKIEDN